ncbi:hypothetical protein COCSUDRAFT_32874 [Coccomyxa subellipsoidea C-169]|uniref:Uncharacterized protein n=1 Tax=Coccomyxa subellipsoidea (strain C-169) TaxID=574566 RepID=I0Z2S3_COCSC|nr:hypothetical protein COCSUDRAFT_32874 [Coccomyxa subellipsoidea C-169]EIE24942.1 hypothetical protein COCSUDRAFT_32874 [Coccomyxa subellipsoidea C-169]|eukprot:XP_005649486.1 hypothetical protein COCSUDRAFT_32874 [Coccomyxa subellipsoidea C-169]
MTPTEPIGSPNAAPSGPGWLALILSLGPTAAGFAIAGVIWHATRDQTVQMHSEFHSGRNEDAIKKQLRELQNDLAVVKKAIVVSKPDYKNSGYRNAKQ